MGKNKALSEIREIHAAIQPLIAQRLSEFERLWRDGGDEAVFCELVFCLMTPQSKARSCGKALEILKEHNLVLNGCADEISAKINIVRFRNNKARYILKARELFSINGKIEIKKILMQKKEICDRRDWLVKNVTGMGYKEASHFLRNIGFGASVAILDRHILRNLVLLGVIPSVPKTITARTYHAIEQKLLAYSKKINIPPDYFDMVLWYKEARDIYK